MFSTRLKPTSSPFECIFICDVSDPQRGCVIEYICPADYPLDSWCKKLEEFLIPCGHKNSLSEEYVLIFTDHEGKLEFVVCLLLPMSGYVICIRSFNPWFELLHDMLTIINQKQLYSVPFRPQLEKYIRDVCLTDGVVTFGSMDYRLVVPDRKIHPFYHRYILEYYNALSIGNWIVILESLLLEKSIIFYSSHFQRITSCILASLSLLYPLVWVHLVYPLLPSQCIDYASCPSPFVAGIHSCLLEKVKNLINADVRLVDLDNDTVYVNGSFGTQLPGAVRHWLARGCNASHQAILKQRQSSRSRNSTAAALLVEPYLELMTILLGGYREAMEYTESSSFFVELPFEKKETSSSFDKPRPGKWHFNREVFVISRGRECQFYLRELLQSQMVIQFFESRVALLNSDLGMIPADDFEDAITRVSGPPRSSLSEFLSRGRVGFSRFARRLKKLRKLRLDHRRPCVDGAPMKISSPFHSEEVVGSPEIPHSFESSLITSTNSAPGDSSASSSSPEPTPYNALSNLRLDEPRQDQLTVLPAQLVEPNSKAVQFRSDFSSFDSALPNPAGQSRRSLVTSIFNAVPDLPSEWLNDYRMNMVQPVSASHSRSSKLSGPNATSNTNELFGTRKSESTKRNCVANAILHAFDPYCPEVPEEEAKPQEPDLTSLLKELDPLANWANDPNDLLK